MQKVFLLIKNKTKKMFSGGLKEKEVSHITSSSQFLRAKKRNRNKSKSRHQQLLMCPRIKKKFFRICAFQNALDHQFFFLEGERGEEKTSLDDGRSILNTHSYIRIFCASENASRVVLQLCAADIFDSFLH